MKDYQPNIAGKSAEIGHGQVAEHEETTHLSVVDQWGNAVAVTTTLNGGYGSYTVVGGAGFLLNNENGRFQCKARCPEYVWSLGTEANAIAPNKRMLSSMTPTIVLKNKKPYIVVGTLVVQPSLHQSSSLSLTSWNSTSQQWMPSISQNSTINGNQMKY
jgi:gamma-glutamyltranspeptidase/glutathione hydrolase